MKIKSSALIDQLIANTKDIIARVNRLTEYDEKLLNHKANANKWSALECIEHLNLYAEFYNKEITNRIKTSKPKSTEIFKSGKMGDSFVNSMLPSENMKPMKTFKSKNPAGSKLSTEVLDRFIKLQKELLHLLEKSRSINLNKTKTSLTIMLLKLRLGDTFRFIVAHNQRHVLQAEKAVNQSSN